MIRTDVYGDEFTKLCLGNSWHYRKRCSRVPRHFIQRTDGRAVERLTLANGRMGAPIRRMVPLLLHSSTVSWFLGGLALIAAASWLERDARLVTRVFVGSLYLFAALGNLSGTRGFHPGWMLMAAALVLIPLISASPFAKPASPVLK